MKLGRLKKVDLREVWKTEAQHFTPWLANEENLALLGDTIGLDLECEAGASKAPNAKYKDLAYV